MKQPGVDHRHRDKNGEIGRKHGNTHVGTLRKHYGDGFASGFKDTDTLAHVLAALDEPSLGKLIKDHEGGKLAEHIATQKAAVTIGPPDKVILSANAAHSIAIRDLDPAKIVEAVRNARLSDVKIDPVNGNFVYRDGTLRIVATRDRDTIVVLTTIKTDELTPPPDGR